MNSSTVEIPINISNDFPTSSTTTNQRIELSANNLTEILKIHSFAYLDNNWDSYGANKPSKAAIVKAVNFIQGPLNSRNLEVFFVAPTPDGDIVVELQNNKSNIEFIFSSEESDRIIASHNGDCYAEEFLNDTTFYSYLIWLQK